MVDQAYACYRCARVTAQALGDVPALAEELATTVSRTDRIERLGTADTARGARGEAPTDFDAWATTADLPVGPICDLYRRERRCEHPFRYRRLHPNEPSSCQEIRPVTTSLLVTATPIALDAAQVIADSTRTIVGIANQVATIRGIERPPIFILATRTIGPVCGPARPWPQRTCNHDSCQTIGFRELPIVAASRFLLGQLEWIRHQDDAPATLRELQAAAAVLEQVIDRPPDLWYAGPCDECHRDMYALPGAQSIDCDACGLRYDVAARRKWLLIKAKDTLGTATEIARAIVQYPPPEPGVDPGPNEPPPRRITPAVVRGLAHRGRIARRGGTVSAPRYRVADVMDELEKDATRHAQKRGA